MKKAIPVLLLILLLFSCPIDVLANQDDFITDLIPNVESSIDPIYNEYPLWNYNVDASSGWFDALTPILVFIINILFLILAFLMRLTIMLIEQAYTLDLLNIAIKELDQIIEPLKDLFWTQFLVPLVAVVGLYIVYLGAVESKRTKSYHQAFVSFIIILVATGVLMYPGQLLTFVNEVSKSLSASIIKGATPFYGNDVTDVESASVAIGNEFWNHHVVYPWYLMQWGNISEGQQKERDFLPYSPGDQIRKDNVDREVDAGNWLMTSSGLVPRFLILVLLILYDLITMAVLVIISILIIISQFVPLVFILFAPVVMTLSLIPWFGFRLINKWFERIIGALFYKVVLSIFLSIIMIFSTAFYNLFGDYAILSMLVQIVLVLAVILYRKQILGMFTQIPRGAAAVAEQMNQRVDAPGQIAAASAKAMDVQMAKDNSGWGAAAIVAAGYGGYSLAGGRFGVAQMYGKFKEGRERKKLHPAAEKFLVHRYQQEKDQAEQRSRETGEEVRYSDFVQQVDRNIERGLPLFSRKQIDSAVDTLYDVKSQGGDINRLYYQEGVNASTPKDYFTQQHKYLKRMSERKKQFEEKVQNRKKLVTDSENLPLNQRNDAIFGAADKPVEVSDETRLRQEQFQSFVNQQKDTLQQKPERMTISDEHQSKIDTAATLKAPRAVQPQRYELTDRQKAIVDEMNRLKGMQDQVETTANVESGQPIISDSQRQKIESTKAMLGAVKSPRYNERQRSLLKKKRGEETIDVSIPSSETKSDVKTPDQVRPEVRMSKPINRSIKRPAIRDNNIRLDKGDIGQKVKQLQPKVKTNSDLPVADLADKLNVRITIEDIERQMATQPVKNLNFDVNDISKEFREAVRHDFETKKQQGYTPEQYIKELSQKRREAYHYLSLLNKGKDKSSEYEDNALYAKANYVHLTKMRNVAADMLNVKVQRYKKRK